MTGPTPPPTRRDLLAWTLAAAAAAETGKAAAAAPPASALEACTADTVRDRLWIWTHAEGAYKTEYGLPRTSRMKLHAQRTWYQEGPPRGPAGDGAP